MKQLFDPERTSIEQMRRESSKKAKMLPILRGTSVTKITIGQLNAEWVTAKNVIDDRKRAILFFHSGGTMGSCDTHRDLAARISKSSGTPVLVLEYRLAPEHKYPAANEDCLSAYCWLIEQGFDPMNIVVGGDSWGSALALMTLLSLRDSGLPLPVAAFLLSPWDNMRFNADSYQTRAQIDPYCSLMGFQTTANHYFGHEYPHPSLIEQSLEGLPPFLIHVGGDEVIFDDAVYLAERAQEAGVEVQFEVWKDMWHVFHTMAFMMPEAKRAIESIGVFIKNKAASCSK